MGDSTTTLTLAALLCLGFCRGPWDLVQAGVFPKPSIWADPGPMVTVRSPVTIWCQGSLQAETYSLVKEGGSQAVETKILHHRRDKIGFFIKSTSSHTAGWYRCAYRTSKNDFSELSDPLSLVVTGMYLAPSLSAQPRPVVASGGKVSLSCSSPYTWCMFHLLKEGGADLPTLVESRIYDDGRQQAQALFPVGAVNTSHGGTYRCYCSYYPNVWSHPSDPLHLEITGMYRKPVLSAQPGTLVPPGDNLTLQCHSEVGFDRFALTKDEGLTHPQHLDGQHSPDFPLVHVTQTHGGQYRCYSGHNLSYAWSAPSDPLDVLITGTYKKPSLLAQPGSSVSWGENVTLQCRSELWFDTFHLHKEGSPAPPQHLRLQDTAASSQANFVMSPVTSAHRGTYRCYGSHSTSPYLLSHPSDPLKLMVSGDSTATELGPQRALLNVLTGVSVAIVLLLSLLLVFFLRHRCLGKNRTSDLSAAPKEGTRVGWRLTTTFLPAVAVSEPEDRGLQKNSNPAADVQEDLYAVVEDIQPEYRRLNSKTAASEDPQDVTYAQLDHLTLRRGTSTPASSPSEEPSDEPSLYTALAIH